MKAILLLYLPIYFTGFFSSQAQQFEILGTVKGQKEVTVYFQHSFLTAKTITDSVVSVKGKFNYKGYMAAPTQYLVSIRQVLQSEPSNAFTIFIEPKTQWLQISVTNESVKYKFSGSQTNKDFEWLDSCRQAIAEDSIKLQKLEALETGFLDMHPNSVISALIVAPNCNSWPLDRIEKSYNNLYPVVQHSEYGQAIKKFIAEEKISSPGKAAKNFSTRDARGNTIQLKQFSGKYVLLDFWASWCAPCRAGFPMLKSLYNKYRIKDFIIIGISEDTDEAAWRKAIADDNINEWYNVRSGFSIEKFGTPADSLYITGNYGVHSFPTRFLLNPDGIIVGKWKGETRENNMDLEKILSKIFE